MQQSVRWIRGVTLALSVVVVLSGLWFTQFAMRGGLRDAVLGRQFPAAPLGMFVTMWGLMYVFRIVRLVRRKA